MDVAHREIREERTKEPVDDITEKQFLKNLHLFMKKRDTPIERIPNLGFKQIDLFVMFQTVKELGGYHQVTAQQLWKQVYNRLGGNPRSTSAATCTRRHYEKLLLPYECHVKGIMMNILPHHQPKHIRYANYSKDDDDDDDDGQRPAKRKFYSFSIPLRQNLQNLQSDPHEHAFPLPLHYPHYYHPSHAVLPPHVPISSSVMMPHSPPAASQPQYTFHPYRLNSTDRVKEPLEQLRYLAEQYKTSSGLSEPLNLSVKAPRQETNSNPASSFSPPPSSKNPKFLNKASPLYAPHCPRVVRGEGCETEVSEAGLGDTPYSYPGKDREGVLDVNAITASSSPTYDSAAALGTDEGAATMAEKPSSPKTDFSIRSKEEREGSPDVSGLNLILPSLPRDNGGKMEIEIPLSVFHNWLRLCGSATMHGAKQLPTHPALEEHSAQRSCSDEDVPTDLTFHANPRHQSSAAEDLRLRKRNLPSPTLTTQTTAEHHNTSQDPFTSYKPLPSGGILKNAASRDVYPFHQQDIYKSYSSKAPWDETQAPPIQAKMNSSPRRVQQDLAASKTYNEDNVQDGMEKSEMSPSAVIMVNSSSASLLHFTTEEVMKLKKIISSS